MHGAGWGRVKILGAFSGRGSLGQLFFPGPSEARQGVPSTDPITSITALDYNDGQFFKAMEWLRFFFRPPLPSMVFQWF